jgi:hypothetical protein
VRNQSETDRKVELLWAFAPKVVRSKSERLLGEPDQDALKETHSPSSSHIAVRDESAGSLSRAAVTGT